MTSKLYESIKLRLDRLAEKGIDDIGDMTPEDKNEFDYIVNVLTRISDMDIPEVLEVFDYVDVPQDYTETEEVEVADRIGSSVELTEAEQNERKELERIAISQTGMLLPRPPIYFDRSDILMARESREEQDRRSEKDVEPQLGGKPFRRRKKTTVGHKSSISTHIVLGAATVCMAVLGSFA
jgi:hypothetical protein